MNAKVLIAFVAGMVLASGLVYVALKPAAPVAEKPVAAVAPAPVAGVAPVAELRAMESKPSPMTELPKPVKRVKYEDSVGAPAAAQRPVAKVDPVPSAPSAPPPPPSTPPPAPEAPREREVVREPAAPAAPPTAPPIQPHTVTVSAGTSVAVRMGETLSTKNNKPGDTFFATLSQPLVVDGLVLAERGARAEGRVVEAERAGKAHGLANLRVELTKITTSDGQHVRIQTASFDQQGKSRMKKDVAKVGIGAALGAAIGAIAGGGKGAGIGAGVGGAAGGADVLLTRGDESEIRVETLLTFQLQAPVTITERLR